MLEKKAYADTMEMLASLLAFLKQNLLNLKIVSFKISGCSRLSNHRVAKPATLFVILCIKTHGSESRGQGK